MKEKTRTLGIKRIICLALMLLLTLGVAGSVAILSEVQADAITVYNVSAYSQELINGTANIVLGADIVDTNSHSISKNAVSIDLNGHTLTIDQVTDMWGSPKNYTVQKPLSIVGTGTIIYKSVDTSAFLVFSNGGSLTIQGSSAGSIKIISTTKETSDLFIMTRETADHNTASAPGRITIKNVEMSGFHDTIAPAGSLLGLGVYNYNQTPAYHESYWNVSISNSKFSDCSAKWGGVIAVFQDTDHINLSVSDCVFDGNTAIDGSGGAIYFVGGCSRGVNTLTVSNTTFTNNKALSPEGTTVANGGAISIRSDINSGTHTITGCTFQKNSADENSGAIDFLPTAGPQLILTDNYFQLNHAAKYGGAIFGCEKLTITGGTFTQNTAGVNGGAINSVKSLSLTNVELTNNVARLGGAVYNSATMNDTGCYYYNNRATEVNDFTEGNGGAVYNTGTMTTSSEYVSNQADSYGGAIYSTGTLTTSGDFTNNFIPDGGAGGAIYSFATKTKPSKMTVKGGTFQGNCSSGCGGAISSITEGDTGCYATLIIENGTFKGSEGSDGGAICLNGTTGTIKNGVFENNHATDRGGAVYVGIEATLTIEGGTFNKNTVNNDGGALAAVYGNLTLGTSTTKPIITNNTAKEEGGGVFALLGTLTINNATIGTSGNPNTAVEGGGVYADRGETVNINGGTISYNKATTYGGGISVVTAPACDEVIFNMTGGSITNNSAGTAGGGVYQNATMNISGSPIINNNLKGTAANNLFLPVGKTFKITGTLGSTAKIGVTASAMSTTSGPIQIVTTDSNANTGTYQQKKVITISSVTPVLTDGSAYIFSDNTAFFSGIGLKSNTATGTTASLYDNWTLSFNANSGSVSPTSKTVIYGIAVGTLPTPTRTGYTFKGWYTATTGGTQYTSSTVYSVAGNTTLYAQWTASTYTLTFNANGGTTPNPTSKTVTYGAAVGTLATTSRTGYTFKGWFTAVSGGTQYTAATIYNVVGNTPIYAQWTPNTYTLTFDANGGTTPSPTSKPVTYGAAVGTLATTSREGYTFKGWFTAKTGGTQYTTATTYNVVGNTTVYAQWTVNSSYTLTFDANGGSTPSPASKPVTYDVAVGALATTTRTGYTFKGWFTEKTGGTQYTTATVYKVAGNTTLYAQWTAVSYTLTFDANGGTTASPASKPVTYDAAVGALATTTRTGYTFKGWFTAKTGGTQYTTATVYKVAGNTTLYAQWTATSYTLTFDANGGTTASPASKPVTYDAAVGALATTTRTGYTFKGWFTAKMGGTQYTADTIYKVAGNTTIYAQWTPITYTITYYEVVGSATAAQLTGLTPTTYTPANAVTLPEAPAKTGYSVVAWYDNAACTGTAITTITAGSTGNKTLYAKYTLLPPDKFAISYDYAGGTSNPANPSEYTAGTAVTLKDPLAAPAGTEFDHWINDKNETVTGIPTTATGDQHFTAVYKNLSYTIKYYQVIDGTATLITPALTPATYTHGTAVTLPAVPAKTGKVADGWYQNKEGTGNRILEVSKTSSGDVSVYVLYTDQAKPEHTITYVLNGGTNHADNPAKYTEGATVTLKDPSKTGLVFQGWFEDAAFTKPTTGVKATDTANKTFYAKFGVSTESLIKDTYKSGVRVKLDLINAFVGTHLGYDATRNEYAVHAATFDLSTLLVDGAGTLNWVVTDERTLNSISYLTFSGNTVTISNSGYYKCVGTATDSRTCTIYVYAPGDVDADKYVTSYDAAKVSRHNGGMDLLTDAIALLMADTNNDWIISSYDWGNIINYNTLGHPLSVPQNAQAERTAIYAVLSDRKFSI